MKIAILTSGILPIPAVQGGAVENLIDFYLEYNDKHHLHDITVYSVFHPNVSHHPNNHSIVNHYYYIDTTSLWARIKRRIYYYFRKGEPFNHFIGFYLHQALKHLKRQNYDTIILENRPNYAIKLIGNTNAKLIYHLHNELLTKETPNCEILYDAAYKIICVSDYISNGVKAIKKNDTKCTTVHNGIDIEAFSHKNENIITRKHLGLKKEDFVIVYNGRINKDKGINELINAIILLNDYPQIKLIIMGSSFFADATKENDFIKLLKNKAESVKDRILFTGFVPYKTIPSYLHLADIAVLPSMWEEPFGLTILEAMAAGLPVITTNCGGIPEICKDVAILLERNDIINNLRNSISMLYNDPQKRKIMSERSIVASSNFGKDKYAKAFFKAICNQY